MAACEGLLSMCAYVRVYETKVDYESLRPVAQKPSNWERRCLPQDAATVQLPAMCCFATGRFLNFNLSVRKKSTVTCVPETLQQSADEAPARQLIHCASPFTLQPERPGRACELLMATPRNPAWGASWLRGAHISTADTSFSPRLVVPTWTLAAIWSSVEPRQSGAGYVLMLGFGPRTSLVEYGFGAAFVPGRTTEQRTSCTSCSPTTRRLRH